MSDATAIAVQPRGCGVLTLERGGADVLRARNSTTRPVPQEGSDARSSAPDDALVARVREGDREAYEVLVSRYQDRVFTIVRSFVDDPDDALDISQETFIKAYQGLKGFRGGSSFYTWLYRIAVNNCKDFLRKRSARPALSLEDEHLQEFGFEPAAIDSDSNPVEFAETRELRDVVRTAVNQLPEKLRAAVVLHDIQGLPQQDVAAILDCPLGTAKSHVFRGRARLRKLLSRYVEGGE